MTQMAQIFGENEERDIGLIRPIGYLPIDSPTCKLVDPLTC